MKVTKIERKIRTLEIVEAVTATVIFILGLIMTLGL